MIYLYIWIGFGGIRRRAGKVLQGHKSSDKCLIAIWGCSSSLGNVYNVVFILYVLLFEIAKCLATLDRSGGSFKHNLTRLD